MMNLTSSVVILKISLWFGIAVSCCWWACNSECENGCSGHGRCTVYDMCFCDRNWQSNDCSERICEYHEAFVSTPKGDLDSSDSIDGPDELVLMNSINYPYGTTELFPEMRDSRSRLISQSAHEYSECSNAGICNRKSGICDCFEGFEGAGCQRMICPKDVDSRVCSGHGICQSLHRIARKNEESKYGLWNKDTIRGCICDPGFYGFDCSLRTCKQGLDPLYIDDVGTIQIPSFFVAVMSTSPSFDLVNGFFQAGTGYFRLVVFDKDGEDWLTEPIKARSSCGEIIKALEDIPHNVIPKGQTVCYSTSYLDVSALNPSNFRIRYDALYKKYFTGDKTYTLTNKPAIQEFGYTSSALNFSDADTLVTGDLYLLQFFGNVGDFRQPEVNIFTEHGSRPSLVSTNGSVVARVWTNGQQGMSIDYFADRCEDMQVQVIESDGQWFLWGTAYAEAALIKCINFANHNPDDDEVFRNVIEWDTGTLQNPHAARLVRTTADVRDGGYFILFYFDRTVKNFDAGAGRRADGNFFEGAFRLLNPFQAPDDDPNVLFTMFATNGTVLMAGNRSEAVFDFGSNIIYTTNVTSDLNGLDYDGDVSCETRGIPTDIPSDLKYCLDKEDFFFLADPYHTPNNPRYMNMYKAKSIRRVNDKGLNTIAEDYANFGVDISRRGNLTSRYRKNIITTDLHTNWAQDASSSAVFHIYKFIPDEDTSYRYVAECSNRGLCNPFEGLCECFFGYTGDNCAIQNTVVS